MGRRGEIDQPAQGGQERPTGGVAAVLSKSEMPVIELVAAGMTNAEIAARLGKSPATVKNQVATILRKLGVRTRAAAAVRWVGEADGSRPPEWPRVKDG